MITNFLRRVSAPSIFNYALYRNAEQAEEVDARVDRVQPRSKANRLSTQRQAKSQVASLLLGQFTSLPL